MKFHFYLLLFVLLAGILVLPSQQAKAQATLHDTVSYAVGDTMFVAWQHSDGTPRISALLTTIMGDTVTGGARADANRVYKLKTNGYYWEADDIANSFPLRLVADAIPSTDGADYPPVLQMTDKRADGSAAALHLITAGADVTLKNIYVSGRTTGTGAQTAYQPILFAANNSHYTIDGCIFEQSNFALVVFTGANNTCVVTNNKFRNLQESPVTQQYTGRGISIWTDEVSVVIENNTFFNLGFASFQMEGGSSKYLRYNHNTVINSGRGVMSNSGDWWQNAYFANNLFINCWWQGERFADTHASGRDPRETHNGLFIVNPLPSGYGPEQGRRIVVAKDFAFMDPRYLAKYGASASTDSIVRVWFTDPVSIDDYWTPYKVNGTLGGHMYIADTTWLTGMPAGMADYLGDANWLQPAHNVTGATFVDSAWSLITDIYAGITGGTQLFYHPSVYPTDETWPLPDPGGYTDATLKTAGTDGLPIGDLNYFPTQKATFLANQTAYVSQIEQLAGAVKIFPLDSTVEAENCTVGGTAQVQSTQGLLYYDYIGNGKVQWTFTAPDAGQYDTKWYVNMTGRGQSGPDLAIDDSQFVDRHLGWGQFVFDPTQGPAAGLSNSAWVWVPIVADSVEHSTGVFGSSCTNLFTFAAGSQHTIGVVGGGWGEVDFAEIDLVKHGNTDTLKLMALNAVADLPTPKAVGAKWVASKFKFVSLGTGGTVAATVKAPEAGTYHLRTFYQNGGGTQSIQIKEGSNVLATESFAGKADSTGLDDFSVGFTLSAGSHTLILSGANVNIDYFQLLSDSTVTGVRAAGNTPYSYSLEQNYPNPFNPSTTIKFSVSKPMNVKLFVYNVLGQKVATLVNGMVSAGPQSAIFDASHLASGVYFYRLEAGDFVKTEKMLLLK